MTECEKIIKRDAFLKAIEVEDAPSAAEGLDVEHMALESKYEGPELGDKMTLEEAGQEIRLQDHTGSHGHHQE
jgi:serine/threonine-protein phosphatase 5